MRIISARVFAFLVVMLAAQPIGASDLFYEPDRIKRFVSFEKCLTELQREHSKAKLTEKSKKEDTPDGVLTMVTRVSDVLRDHPKTASFTVQEITTMQPKPGGRDGFTFGSGTDWYCNGRVMWKGGGHSANVPIPAAPSMPSPPAPITPKS
ncbi:MAG: hypothetical protein IPP23_03470 [Sphingomonadales bacterium]|nr:hypothetical protein [Sphingomonadales bacterium]